VRDLAGLGQARRRVVALREAGVSVTSDLFGFP